MAGMKILITGSSGHLGEALVRTLQNKAHEIVSLDINSSPFTSMTGSITDTECVEHCMDGVDVVYHTATLHKPHVVTHSKQQFIDVNVSGTLTLLEAAVAAGVRTFIFTSTTSLFGDALRPPPDQPAAWVTEQIQPVPKNIYGVTKTAAEDLCHLFHRRHGLDCIILRTSRFFMEEDDNEVLRKNYSSPNTKANEFLYRRVDLADVVSAHLLASEKAANIGFGRYIISATTPFLPEDLTQLRNDAPAVLRRRVPEYAEIYQRRDWKMFTGIDRVYINAAARTDLHWRPEYDFRKILSNLHNGDSLHSPLALSVGKKGYHEQSFTQAPYPVESD